MFNKKTDAEERSPELVAPSAQPTSTPAPKASRDVANAPAAIGPTIRIRGDLSGDEDLLVQGTVEGTIDLPKNLVIIGQDGQVNAIVNARTVEVEGKVEGDLRANEQVVLRRSGQVRGNITAPRVTIEDGCRFKGSIDMDVEAGAGAKVSDLKPAGVTGSGGDDGNKKAGNRS